MEKKNQIRKKFFRIRKNKYFDITGDYFNPLINFLNNKFRDRSINLSLYYPSNYEVNVLKLFDTKKNKFKFKFKTLLPLINKKNFMQFNLWNNFDLLKINKYGMLEPKNNKIHLIPNVLLVPLLAYDKLNYRIGYGKGYYDKCLNKYFKLKKDIITVGVAFSFQKYDKLPTQSHDVRLNYILTDKGLHKK